MIESHPDFVSKQLVNNEEPEPFSPPRFELVVQSTTALAKSQLKRRYVLVLDRSTTVSFFIKLTQEWRLIKFVFRVEGGR